MSYKRFCEEMQIARSTGYYKPKGESQHNIDIMRHMDEIYLDHPTAGVLTMVNLLSLDYGIDRITFLVPLYHSLVPLMSD